MFRLYHLVSRPYGQGWGQFAPQFECKEYKSVKLLVDERVNYRWNAVFVTLFEIETLIVITQKF